MHGHSSRAATLLGLRRLYLYIRLKRYYLSVELG